MSALQEYYPSKFSMIHVVGDVVLLVGITVFLNSKINSQAAEIVELKKQNEILFEKIKQIEQFLGQATRGRPQQQSVKEEEESEEIDT